MTSLDLSADASSLIITSAFYHPDNALRDRLREVLEAWLAGFSQLANEAKLRDILAGETGTAIEPFELEPADLECAITIARAAFSNENQHKRFRITSRQNFGKDGGLVITQNLKSFYVERFAFGKVRGAYNSGCIFLPRLVPRTPGRTIRKGKVDLLDKHRSKARLTTDAHGYTIVIKYPEGIKDTVRMAREIQKHGRILGEKQGFDQLGIRVECQPKHIRLLSGSPEALIRLMGHMSKGSVIHLQMPESSYPEILLGLEMPIGEKVGLKCLIGTSSAASDWLRADLKPAIPIATEDKRAIASWLFPHIAWLNDLWEIAE